MKFVVGTYIYIYMCVFFISEESMVMFFAPPLSRSWVCLLQSLWRARQFQHQRQPLSSNMSQRQWGQRGRWFLPHGQITWPQSELLEPKSDMDRKTLFVRALVWPPRKTFQQFRHFTFIQPSSSPQPGKTM